MINYRQPLACLLLLFPSSAFACFAPDGSYELAHQFIFASALIFSGLLWLYPSKVHYTAKIAMSIGIIAILAPTEIAIINRLGCCDCGHRALFWSQATFAFSIISIVFVSIKKYRSTKILTAIRRKV